MEQGGGGGSGGDGGGLQISDKTVLDLENRVLDSGVSEDSDAVDLAVNATDVLGPFVDALVSAACHGRSCPNDAKEELEIQHREEKDLDRTNNFANGAEEHDDRAESEEERSPPGARDRGGATCSRSSTFSERSIASCESFVSAESRLEPFAEREELIKMFETFDENGDGKISCEELGNTMRKLGFEMSRPELEGMLVAVDNDGDGFVDFDQFLALYSSLYYDDEHRERDNFGVEERELQEVFSVFDKNRDGFISVAELQGVLSRLGLKGGGVKLSDCQRMIKGVDSDGDGQVNFEEFKKMMASKLLQQDR